eukprot:CAMPEP_0175040528 /NCGR_PEP_ID=MMETSP0052_2-20121109/1321_1 /TAXON_ID=51329 ORGANISM="Polytomella parva, Strain SAG 63-3" /NCGR_SAMPLE_ID=MMETSP0052_2 /ASSEMBLY_ACC=CAM_ASM_000194 /LENGTH=539 /DNA_ID=CAMNT_0016302765 /DNA_START=1526 /DNA_END=3145 /DNA_ORIENTATION=+
MNPADPEEAQQSAPQGGIQSSLLPSNTTSVTPNTTRIPSTSTLSTSNNPSTSIPSTVNRSPKPSQREESKRGMGLGRLRPLIYVYDSPLSSSNILQYSVGANICSWRYLGPPGNISYWMGGQYNVETYFHEALMTSEHRTFDPEEADFFYVPVYLSCLMSPVMNSREQPQLTPTLTNKRVMHGTYLYHHAYEHIRQNYPFWNRSHGHDHIFLTPHDEGACYLPYDVYVNSTLLTSWGRTDINHTSGTTFIYDNYSDFSDETKSFGAMWQNLMGRHPCYDPVKDLVIPAFKSPRKYIHSPLMDYPPMKRDILFYARGNMGTANDPMYSRNIRQKLLSLSVKHQWDKNFSIYVIEKSDFKDYYRPCIKDMYSHQLARSKFCAVVPGDGFSSRFEDAVVHGCIPIIIQDRVHMPFESILDIDSFSVRLSESKVDEHLPHVLLSISDEQVERMQRRLGTVYHRFMYYTGVLFPEELSLIRSKTSHCVNRQLKASATKTIWPKGHAFQHLKHLPHRSDAFYTVMQWLRWRWEVLEAQGKVPVKL